MFCCGDDTLLGVQRSEVVGSIGIRGRGKVDINLLEIDEIRRKRKKLKKARRRRLYGGNETLRERLDSEEALERDISRGRHPGEALKRH